VLELINRPAYSAWHQLLFDQEGYECLLVVVKGSFHIKQDRLVPLQPHAPVEPADVFRGDPSCSSISTPSDLVLDKPGADVLLSGSAHPHQRGDTSVQVDLQVGALHKRAVVWGDRRWRSGALGTGIAGPAPLESVPLVYERAFGGAGFPDNPAGTGFLDGTALPNIEHPRHLITSPADRPPPCGFGPLAPHWPQRRRFAGTYDTRWRSERMPLPPADFDPRFNQCAPADQTLQKSLRGDEAVQVAGVRPGGTALKFQLPARSIFVTIHDGTRRHEMPARLDTLHVRADVLRCDLTWRAAFQVHGRLYDVAWILVDERAELSHG
jgi:hypothetical protein